VKRRIISVTSRESRALHLSVSESGWLKSSSAFTRGRLRLSAQTVARLLHFTYYNAITTIYIYIKTKTADPRISHSGVISPWTGRQPPKKKQFEWGTVIGLRHVPSPKYGADMNEW